MLKPATARDVNLRSALRKKPTTVTVVQPDIFASSRHPHANMDEEEVFGIPSDYYSNYSEETPLYYSENVPTSSFDEFLDETPPDKLFEDFGKCMRVTLISSILYCANLYAMIGPYNSSPEPSFGGPSEPGMALYNTGAPGHRGLGLIPSGLPPHLSPSEYSQPSASRDQSVRCMHSIVRRFLPTDLFL